MTLARPPDRHRHAMIPIEDAPFDRRRTSTRNGRDARSSRKAGPRDASTTSSGCSSRSPTRTSASAPTPRSPSCRRASSALVPLGRSRHVGPRTRPPPLVQRAAGPADHAALEAHRLADGPRPAIKPIIRAGRAILTRIDQDLLAPLLDGKAGDLAKIIPELSAAVADAGKAMQPAPGALDPKTPDSPSSAPTSCSTTRTRRWLDLKNELTQGRARR